MRIQSNLPKENPTHLHFTDVPLGAFFISRSGNLSLRVSQSRAVYFNSEGDYCGVRIDINQAERIQYICPEGTSVTITQS